MDIIMDMIYWKVSLSSIFLNIFNYLNFSVLGFIYWIYLNICLPICIYLFFTRCNLELLELITYDL